MVTVSKYRITARELLQTIENWEHLINFKVNLIGCDGTALTLLEVKESTKDIDFIVFAEALLDRGLISHHFIEKVEAYK